MPISRKWRPKKTLPKFGEIALGLFNIDERIEYHLQFDFVTFVPLTCRLSSVDAQHIRKRLVVN